MISQAQFPLKAPSMQDAWENLQLARTVLDNLPEGHEGRSSAEKLVASLEARLDQSSGQIRNALKNKHAPFSWIDGEIRPWDEATLPAMTHGAHYGSSVYEGIRFYETDRGPAIFKLDEHIKRLFYSASTLHMELGYTHSQMKDAICEVVALSGLSEGYIRPFATYGQKMGLVTVGAPVIVGVLVWPWGQYLKRDVAHIKIAETRRLSPKAFNVQAKIGGHYVNSIRAGDEIREPFQPKDKYDEALLLDDNGYIAEGAGENFFVIKGNKLITPRDEFVLHGITRDVASEIGESLGMQVVHQDIRPDQVYSFKEAFFTGTAAEITPIGQIDDLDIGTGGMGEATGEIKKIFNDMKVGKCSDDSALTYVQDYYTAPEVEPNSFEAFVRHIADTRND